MLHIKYAVGTEVFLKRDSGMGHGWWMSLLPPLRSTLWVMGFHQEFEDTGFWRHLGHDTHGLYVNLHSFCRKLRHGFSPISFQHLEGVVYRYTIELGENAAAHLGLFLSLMCNMCFLSPHHLQIVASHGQHSLFEINIRAFAGEVLRVTL